MVKGITRQVILVKSPDPRLFEEAIFIVKEEALNREGVTAVPWNFTLFPSAQFKEDFGASLLKYVQGTKDWDTVVKDMVAGWERESSAATA